MSERSTSELRPAPMRGKFGFVSMFHAVGGCDDNEFSGMSEPEE